MLGGPGYRLHQATHWIAEYKPQLSWIITNPFAPKRLVNRALVEEFCHNSLCSSRPAQLHPVINWLRGAEECPGPDEYRDLVEAIAVVACPLAKSKPVSKRSLPRAIPNEYRDLGRRIMDLAVGLAQKADTTFLPSDARRKALWAVIAFLNYVVPLLPDQGPKILAFLESLHFPGTWSNEHAVFEFLLARTASLVRSHKTTDLGFTITQPRDPHIILSSMFQVFDAARSIPSVERETRMEVLRSIFPVLLHEITFGNAGIVPLYWLRARGDEISVVVEVWDETPGWLASTQQSMSLALNDRSSRRGMCAARRIYQEVHEMVRGFVTTGNRLGPYRLFQVMMGTIPALVAQHFDFGSGRPPDCFHCREHLYDAKTARIANRFISMPDSFREECVAAASGYERWLIHEGLEYISVSLNTDLTLRPRPISPLAVQSRKALLPWVKVISPDASVASP
jgi:hypothetical protein